MRLVIGGQSVNPVRILVLLVASCILVPSNAFSQAIAARTSPTMFAVFGTFSAEKLGGSSDTAQYGSFVSGITLGGFAQFRPWLGIEGRGGILRWGNDEHRNTALLGPRVVFPHRRFRFDGVFLAGLSHAGYVHQPIIRDPAGKELISASANAAIEIAGGVDYRLTHRLYWEIGDVGYNHIFTQNGPGGITFSSGLVLRLF